MRKIFNLLKELLTLLLYSPIYISMWRERRKGLKIVTYQLSSAGQLQYMMPLHKKLSSLKTQKLSFYVSMDYAMVSSLSALKLPKEKFFPSNIAKYMSFIDVFLQAEIHSRGPKNAVKIFTGHGQANKLSNWADENLKAFDIYFLHGPLERQMFEMVIESKREVAQHIKMVNIGYPKLDDLVNGKYDRTKILESLNLNPKFKTVLYAPAWDPGGSLRSYGVSIVQTLLSIPDINIIVKLHPASMEPKHSPYFDFYTGGKDWEKEFSIFSQDSRFAFVKDYLINPYLFVSDLLVNDFSGVGLEFMTLDRPVIYIDCPEYFEKTLPSWRCNGDLAKNDERFNGGRHAGTIVEDLASLKNGILLELAQPNLNSSKRKELTQKLMYNPGKGAEIGVHEILKYIN